MNESLIPRLFFSISKGCCSNSMSRQCCIYSALILFVLIFSISSSAASPYRITEFSTTSKVKVSEYAQSIEGWNIYLMDTILTLARIRGGKWFGISLQRNSVLSLYCPLSQQANLLSEYSLFFAHKGQSPQLIPAKDGLNLAPYQGIYFFLIPKVEAMALESRTAPCSTQESSSSATWFYFRISRQVSYTNEETLLSNIDVGNSFSSQPYIGFTSKTKLAALFNSLQDTQSTLLQEEAPNWVSPSIYFGEGLDEESVVKVVQGENLLPCANDIPVMADKSNDGLASSEAPASDNTNGDGNELEKLTLKKGQLEPELESISPAMKRYNTRLLNRTIDQVSSSNNNYQSKKQGLKTLVEDEISSELNSETSHEQRKCTLKTNTRNKYDEDEEWQENEGAQDLEGSKISSESNNEKIYKTVRRPINTRTRNQDDNGENEDRQDLEGSKSSKEKKDEPIQNKMNMPIEFASTIKSTWGRHELERGYFSQVYFILPNTEHTFSARTTGIVYLPFKNFSKIGFSQPLCSQSSNNEIIRVCMDKKYQAESMLIRSFKDSMTLGYFHIRDDQNAYIIRSDEFIELDRKSLPDLRDEDHLLIIPKSVVFTNQEQQFLLNCKYKEGLDTIKLTKALETIFKGRVMTLSTPIVLALFSDREKQSQSRLGEFNRFYSKRKFRKSSLAYFQVIFTTVRKNYKRSSYGFVHSSNSLTSYPKSMIESPRKYKQEEYTKLAQEKGKQTPYIIKLMNKDPLAVAVLTQSHTKELSIFRIREDQEALVLNGEGKLVRIAQRTTPVLEDNDLLFIVPKTIVIELVEKEAALQEIVKDQPRDSETVLGAILEIVAALIAPIGNTIPTFISLFKVCEK